MIPAEILPSENFLHFSKITAEGATKVEKNFPCISTFLKLPSENTIIWKEIEDDFPHITYQGKVHCVKSLPSGRKV